MSYPLVGSYPAAGYGAPHPAVYGAPPPAGGWYPPPVDYGMRPAGYGVPPGQAPPPAGYPAQPPAGPDPYAQPSPGGYAQQPPPAGGYPPQQLALTTPGSEQPQPAPGSYPRQPPAGSYPPQQPPAGGYPPQQPPASSYPPQHPPASGHPQQPAASSYPQQPPAAGYPQQPPASGYPQQPPASGYPQQPPASGYPQQPPAGAYGQPPPGGGYPAGGYDPYAAAAAGYAAPAGYGFYPQPAGYPGYPPPAGYGYYPPPGYYPPGGAYGYPPPGDDRDRRDRSDSRSRERSPRGRKRGGRRGGRGNQEESRQDGGNDDRERRVTRRPADPGCNICVFRIPPDWDEAELQRHFDHFGDVVSCTVVKNPEDGQSKGFGFVGFAEKDAVRRSIMGMDGLPVGHHYENPQKTLSVSPKKGEEAFLTAFPDCYPPAGTYGIEPPNTRAPPGGNLYVYNIPLDWKDINLYRHFIHYGELASVKVMMKEGNEEGRGFGFVGFISPVAAQRAVSGMNGFRLSKDDPGKKLQVTVKRGEEAAASAVKKQISYRDPADPNYGRDTPEEAAAKEAARRLVDTTH